MTTEIKSIADAYEIFFLPTDKQVGEIEKWLIAESKKTGDGFYCNWTIIKSSFHKNELIVISFNNKTVGFATWRLTSEKTARIEIAEIKPKFRKKGIGKKLITELLIFLNDKNICVVDLQCSPENSAPIWKRLGFLDFSGPPEKYNFNPGDNKKLYTILTKHLQASTGQNIGETIELWDDEPYITDKNTLPKYVWNLEFIEGTRKLSNPIIHPAHHKWRICWKVNGKTVKDDKINRFVTKIDFGTFIIIDELIL